MTAYGTQPSTKSNAQNQMGQFIFWTFNFFILILVKCMAVNSESHTERITRLYWRNYSLLIVARPQSSKSRSSSWILPYEGRQARWAGLLARGPVCIWISKWREVLNVRRDNFDVSICCGKHAYSSVRYIYFRVSLNFRLSEVVVVLLAGFDCQNYILIVE